MEEENMRRKRRGRRREKVRNKIQKREIAKAEEE